MGKVMVVQPLHPRSKSPFTNKATQIQSAFIQSVLTLLSTLTKQIYTLKTAPLSPPERLK
jgi:hypothetical protein